MNEEMDLCERTDIVQPEEISALLYAVGATDERLPETDPRLYEYLCAIGTLQSYSTLHTGAYVNLSMGSEPGEILALCPSWGDTILDLPRRYPFTDYGIELVRAGGMNVLVMHLPESTQHCRQDHYRHLAFANRMLKRELERERRMREAM